MSLKQNTKKKNTKMVVFILAAVAVVTAACGIWLLIMPSLEREYVYAAQESMLDDLLQDIHGINEPPLDAEDTAAYLGHEGYTETETQAAYTPYIYYFSSYATDCTYQYEDTAAYDSAYEIYHPVYYPIYYELYYELYYEPIYEPIPDTAFPNAITGIGILTIESINLHLPIAEGVEYATLRIAPGRVPQTAQVGDIGNAVIAGHRNYAFGSMFNRLGELDIGDIIQYQARNGEKMAFVVFEVAVIEPHDQVAFLQPVNDSIITLYTCTPIRTATHRLIIRAQRIS